MSEKLIRDSCGRFTSDKIKSKKRKLINRAENARKVKMARLEINAGTSKEDEILKLNNHEQICKGKRIIDLYELGKNLFCCNCKNLLSLLKITKERREGLDSTLNIQCHKCQAISVVHTGKMHNYKSHSHADTTTEAVLGVVHSGIGCSALNKILACLDIPTISKSLYKKYEREVGAAIEKCAKDSCMRAAEQERQLVIQNIEKLCEEL